MDSHTNLEEDGNIAPAPEELIPQYSPTDIVDEIIQRRTGEVSQGAEGLATLEKDPKTLLQEHAKKSTTVGETKGTNIPGIARIPRALSPDEYDTMYQAGLDRIHQQMAGIQSNPDALSLASSASNLEVFGEATSSSNPLKKIQPLPLILFQNGDSRPGQATGGIA